MRAMRGAMLPERAHLGEGSILEGRYRLDRIVGEGGFGVVYAGSHLTLATPIAVKIVRPDARLADIAGSFLEEARMLSRLRHSNIVRVLDAGVVQGSAGSD